MGNSYGDTKERNRSMGLRILAMIACAGAFAAGVLLPSSPDEQGARSTPEHTRIATTNMMPAGGR